MLNMRGRGELRLLKLSKDVRDEVQVKTVLARFAFTAVPLATIVEGFVGQLALFYSKDDDLKIGDLEYLPVSRHVANVTAVIAGVVIDKSMVDRVRLTPRPGRLVDVLLDVKGDILTGVDTLHDALKTTIEVDLVEHEYAVADDQDDAEPHRKVA